MKQIVLVISCILAIAAATPIQECKVGRLPESVSVEGCEKTPCKLPRGTNVNFKVNFNAGESAEKLSPRVIAEVMGIQVPYPLPPDFSDACKTLSGAQCPFEKDAKVTYSLSFPVSKSYPKASVTVELALVNEKMETVTCFRVPIQTV